MNIEIANRLVELRKKNGYSQEELADKLGLSRQAVSKWERAESSPDTDNLICLARLYNVSLDDLLNTSENTDDIRREVKERETIKEESNIPTKKPVDEKEEKRDKKLRYIESVVSGILFILAIVIYFFISTFHESEWRRLWVIILIPVLVVSIISAVRKRRFKQFAYPVLATLTFLVFGLYFGNWHPSWIVFITIPVYYLVVEPIDRSIAEKRGEEIDEDLEDD